MNEKLENFCSDTISDSRVAKEWAIVLNTKDLNINHKN